MDILQDYTPQLLYVYQTLHPYIQFAQSTLSSVQTQMAPLLLPYLNRLAVFAQDSPAVITVGLLLLLFVISLQILNFARRLIVFWTRIMLQVTFYGGLVVLAMVVWQRGVGRTLGDLRVWAEEIRQVWWMEYRRWEGYQNQGMRIAQAPLRAGNYGNARTAWR